MGCEKILNHVCKKCKKIVRQHIASYPNLKQYRCDHTKTVSSRLVAGRLIRDRGYYCKWLDSDIYACRVCMDEIRKEVVLRKQNERKENQRVERRDESLFQKCAKILVRNPGLLLIAATNYPLDEQMWKSIYNVVPDTLNIDYVNELLESKKINNRWMFNTISEVFGFYKKIHDPLDN